MLQYYANFPAICKIFATSAELRLFLRRISGEIPGPARPGGRNYRISELPCMLPVCYLSVKFSPSVGYSGQKPLHLTETTGISYVWIRFERADAPASGLPPRTAGARRRARIAIAPRDDRGRGGWLRGYAAGACRSGSASRGRRPAASCAGPVAGSGRFCRMRVGLVRTAALGARPGAGRSDGRLSPAAENSAARGSFRRQREGGTAESAVKGRLVGGPNTVCFFPCMAVLFRFRQQKPEVRAEMRYGTLRAVVVSSVRRAFDSPEEV